MTFHTLPGPQLLASTAYRWQKNVIRQYSKAVHIVINQCMARPELVCHLALLTNLFRIPFFFNEFNSNQKLIKHCTYITNTHHCVLNK